MNTMGQADFDLNLNCKEPMLLSIHRLSSISNSSIFISYSKIRTSGFYFKLTLIILALLGFLDVSRSHYIHVLLILLLLLINHNPRDSDSMSSDITDMLHSSSISCLCRRF